MPTFEHGELQGNLRVLLERFRGRRRTPGGWRFSSECEIELFPGERYLPDLAGWKIDALSEPLTGARVRVTPHWVCEVLSPSTADRDTGPKQQIYHQAQIAHYWLVDPGANTLTVLRWAEDGYRTILLANAGARAHAEPFDAIELDLGELFALG